MEDQIYLKACQNFSCKTLTRAPKKDEALFLRFRKTKIKVANRFLDFNSLSFQEIFNQKPPKTAEEKIANAKRGQEKFQLIQKMINIYFQYYKNEKLFVPLLIAALFYKSR